MRKLLAITLALFIATPVFAQETKLNPEDAQKSTVVIQFNKIGGHGSGTFIDPLHILTAGHVLDSIEIKPPIARTKDGKEYKIVVEESVKSPVFDISILKVETDNPYTGPTFKIKCGEIPSLTPLLNIGNPMMAEFVMQTVYTTGGQFSPMTLAEINGEEPKAGPPDAIKPGKPTKKKKLTKKEQAEEDAKKLTQAEQKLMFSNSMILQGSIVSGQSGSSLFDPNGYIVGVLNTTFVSSMTGSLLGLGGAIKITGPVCQFLEDKLGSIVINNS